MAAACLLAMLSACADQWLAPVPEAAGPGRCPTGTVLDTSTGFCAAAACSSDDDCPGLHVCDLLAGVCVPVEPEPGPVDPPACNEGAHRCGATGSRERCDQGDWITDPCPSGARCSDGDCVACQPRSRRCVADGRPVYEVCSLDGGSWRETACPDGAWCAEGQCRICEPGAARCTANGREVCDASGTVWDPAPCGEGTRCDAASAACIPLACTPNEATCHPTDPGRRLVCRPDGSGLVEAACAPGSRCHGSSGLCLDACGLAALEGQGAGCEYWFTHLPSGAALGRSATLLSLRVTNPGTQIARIRVTAERGGAPIIDEWSILPGTLDEFELPWRAFSGTGVTQTAFHLESTAPVIVHTSSRVEGEDRTRCYALGNWEPSPIDPCVAHTQSGGGSLLLPQHLLGNTGSRYVAYSPRHQHEVLPAPALLAIVATRDATTVRVRFTAWTEVSADGFVTAYAPGDIGDFMLYRFDVLQLATARAGAEQTLTVDAIPRIETQNGFTGTHITSSDPIAVFAGADSARVPLQSEVSDHLEEQLPPVSLWGRYYVATRRSPADRFTLIVGDTPVLQALFSATAIGEDGSPLDVLSQLPPRSVVNFTASADFRLVTSAPVMLVQAASRAADGGEHALVVAAPVERWRTRYELRVTATNSAQLHLAGPLLGEDGNAPDARVNGVPVTGWTPLPGTQMRVARVDLCMGAGTLCDIEGFYTVESSEPIGLTVHEHGGGVGAGYTGGLGDLPGRYRPPAY